MASMIHLMKAWGNLQYESLKDGMNKKVVEASSEAQKEIVEQIRKDGIAVLPNYYSAEKCDAVIAEIDRMIAEDKVNIWRDDANSDTRIYGAHLHSDLIREFHEDPYLKEIGEQYLETSLMNSHTLGARLIPKKENLGSGGGWHRDSVYKRQYKSIIYLTDVEMVNGPFEYVSKTHDKSTIYTSIKDNGFTAHQNRMSHELVQEFLNDHPAFKSDIYTAKRGTVILVDTGGIHRGTPIKEGNRYALTNYFYPVHHYTPSQKKKFEKLF